MYNAQAVKIGMTLCASLIVNMLTRSLTRRHLIADHLGWFKDTRTADGKFKTIEHIMKEKGELVKRGRITNGVISFEPVDEQ